MRRTLLALVVGGAIGAATTLVLTRGTPSTGPMALPTPTLSLPSPSQDGAPATPVDDTFYRLLAGAGAAELDTMLSRAAAAPPSSERDLTLALLLKRYSDFDAETAARRARETRAKGPALGIVYSAWARGDPNAALGGLRALEDANDAAEAGAALVEALGNDAAAIERVAAVLSARGDAPTTVGPVPPFPALGPTAPFAATRSTLQLMAERWAAIDPSRALALADDLNDDRLRSTIEVAALRAVTNTRPAAAFTHLDTLHLERRERAVIGALGELVRADPARLLDMVRDFSQDPRRFVEMRALNQLAERDPLAAARYLDGLPIGNERQALVQTVARAFGRQDPTAALAWARTIDERNALAAVIGGIGERDPQRAIDLALELAPGERRSALQAILMRAAAQSDVEVAAIADRLVALEDPSLQPYVGAMLLPQWAARSPESAMRWLVANAETASPNLFQSVGQTLAARNPTAAIAYAEQIPTTAREAWISGLAQGYAQQDPRGALEWFGQFRGESWYRRTAASLAMTLAQHDGAAAAQLIDEADPAGTGPQSQQTLQVVANNWANRDPSAAAQWAIARPAQPQRAQVVEAVVSVWAARDPGAARAWVLQLPSTDLRDRSLARLLTTTAHRSSTTLDAVLLNAFGSDAARQRAVLQTVQSLARMDAVRARAIADLHLTDAALRAQAEAALNGEHGDGTFGQSVIENARIEAVNLVLPAPVQSSVPTR